MIRRSVVHLMRFQMASLGELSFVNGLFLSFRSGLRQCNRPYLPP